MRTALFTLCLGLATPAVAAAPDPTPRFERTSARESQADWMGAKGLSGAGAQLDAVAKRRLLRKVCDDLVDLRALVDAGKLSGFAFRDNVRGRSWARPTLALVLAEAMQRFSAGRVAGPAPGACRTTSTCPIAAHHPSGGRVEIL